LAIFRSRFPSKHDAFLLFAVCVFPIHVWSILNLLWVLPAWVLRSNIWDVVGMIAYTQAVALFESVIVLFVLLLVCGVLPVRVLGERIVAHGSMAVFVTTGWAIGLHYHVDRYISNLSSWPYVGLLLWFAIYVACMGGTYLLICRRSRVKEILDSLVERLSVLSCLYVALDLLGLAVLVFRNV
jgi:hypothetical protein